ncbi:hypothetical protein [Phyllobacterium leguminum]|uniref:Holliday junction resolvasome RuvABC endonuclease subunit n=1 Tax=Phyllobacterium leguminum TaxID=314237 RepID=A0A318T5M5_9HYPH|nr:hypothetical protein [Phyllobacterium leguminum]PYE89615.1 hypothetical protein C7477_103123 [Phyllobacterium leguminum]
MPVILGLDIATVTGFALYDTDASLSSIKTGLIKAEGNDAEQKAASIAMQMVKLITSTKDSEGRIGIDFIALEQPMRNVVSFKKTRQTLAGPVEENTINPNALQLSSLSGAVVGIIAAYRLPWVTIPSSTWRKHFLGMGRSPGFDRAAWKRVAVERCRALRITVKNADAAEAVGIAMAAEASQEFRYLKVGRAAA